MNSFGLRFMILAALAIRSSAAKVLNRIFFSGYRVAMRGTLVPHLGNVKGKMRDSVQ